MLNNKHHDLFEIQRDTNTIKHLLRYKQCSINPKKKKEREREKLESLGKLKIYFNEFLLIFCTINWFIICI